MKEVTIGIDIGGTNTKFGIVDLEGNILKESKIPTDAYPDFPSFLEALVAALKKIQNECGQNRLLGIGIGAPNGNYYNGTIEDPPNLNWKGITHFTKAIQEHFPVPTVLTNDANAAAIGEMVFGGAKGMKNFVVITLGTGLGSGFVVNGQLVYGHDGFAGELGHIIVNVDGRQCGCGRRGCLETYASATGIKRTVFKLLADYNVDSNLRNYSYNELDAKMITEAAVSGDKIAIEAFQYTGRILGVKLADVVATNSPEAIFLFGGLTKAGDSLFIPIHDQLEAFIMPIFRNKVRLLPSALNDRNAAVLGASAMVIKELEGKKI